jgi:hypothetical protein
MERHVELPGRGAGEMRYQSKVHFVEAWQVVLGADEVVSPDWLLPALLCGDLVIKWDPPQHVQIRESAHCADEGDWILREMDRGVEVFRVVDEDAFPNLWEAAP